MAGMGGHLAPEWGVTMLRNIQKRDHILAGSQSRGYIL